ncbi:MAG: sulfatase [Deltaproteobacteria bacterium]|nr:sulfatase [Deltaproteobacteria bacterium]
MSKKSMSTCLFKPMRRREALSLIGGAALAFSGLPFPWSGTAQAESSRRPNILFILSDDHRWDHMGCAGHPFVKTPHLDRLAREGVRFKNAFVTTSLCSPSRASFLTGTYAHTHGVKNNLTPWRNDRTTFMEILKQQGYQTAFIGKWHMPGRLPRLRGVDHFVTFTVQGGQGRYFDCPLVVDGREEPSRKAYITEELTDRAIRFIANQEKAPFCVVLSHKAVHHQFLPPPDLKGLYDNAPLNLPPEMDPWVSSIDGNLFYGMLGPVSFLYRNYCAALTAMDREIGRLLRTLDQLGITRDTLVIYAGDNGYFWGEHNLVDKRYAYEESIRIPFIVRWPALIRNPGRTAPHMVLNVDVAPTILEATGVGVPRFMEGQSLLPVLKRAQAPGRTAWLYEYFRDYPYRVPPHTAVRTRTHKYIEFETERPPELYDLVRDPGERHNLYGTPRGRELAPRLRALLERLRASGGRTGD